MIPRRIILALVALVMFAVTHSLFAQVGCPPNGWYCAVIPPNCTVVGCQKKCIRLHLYLRLE